MPNLVNNINLNRHYRFTFFRLIGSTKFSIQNDPSSFIQDSVNFTFNYNVANNTNNTINLTFYNLSAASIALFSDQNNRRGFQFDAWYGSSLEPDNTQGNITIFRGLTYTVNTYKIGPDVITEVVGCDMFMNLMTKSIVQNVSAGTPFISIIKTALSNYGSVISLNPASEQFLTGSYKSKKIYNCQPITIIEKICADAGLIYSVQQNILSMVPKDLTITQPKVEQIITQKNGLVGYVRPIALSIQLFPITFFTNQNINKNYPLLSVTTLLRHYNLYSTVHLKSESYDGEYGILSLTQNGEWRGNNWYSSLTLWPSGKNKNVST